LSAAFTLELYLSKKEKLLQKLKDSNSDSNWKLKDLINLVKNLGFSKVGRLVLAIKNTPKMILLRLLIYKTMETVMLRSIK